MKLCFLIASVITVAYAQKQQYTTPVPILKQINKHNEDGSYSYGYEAADGTYKIETKYPNGEVFGKYGYIDDQGKLREIEYGASRRGFEPAGSEIQVPPPTLKQNPDAYARPLGPNEEDDGQYREDPSVYYKNDPYYQDTRTNNYQRPQSIYTQPAFRPQPQYDFSPQFGNNNNYRPQQQQYQPPVPQSRSYTPSYYNPQPYQPAPPAYPGYNAFQGHPATNVDIVSGSYTVNYRR